MEQAMRDEFEAWVRTQVRGASLATVLVYSAGNDLYLNPNIQGRYEGWKASRAALRVELPPTITAEEVVEHFNIDEEGIDMAAGIAHMVNGAIAACAAFIKQAGIEVKQNG
ncbi:hypothetical protein ACQQ4Q_005941 [Pseudomonas aeruginosa]